MFVSWGEEGGILCFGLLGAGSRDPRWDILRLVSEN